MSSSQSTKANDPIFESCVATQPSTPRPYFEAIDLTTDVICCAGCSKVLGEGHGIERVIYTLDGCGCMVCGDCISCGSKDIQQSSEVLIEVAGVFCPREDHSSTESQSAYRTWGLECAICSQSLAKLYGIKKPLLNCGHWFCQDCIEEYIKCQRELGLDEFRCPMCRLGMGKDIPFIFLRAIPQTIKVYL